MSTRSPNCFLGRRSRTRQDIHAAGLDALVVTHLPNVRYLTGFNGTAGLLVLTEHKCLLVVDFRYAAAARAVAQSEEDPSAVSVVVAQRSYDETLVQLLLRAAIRRTGIEGASMPVGRFNKLSAALAAAGPTPLMSEDPCPVLVPTERLIERARMLKDPAETAILREAGRRLAAVAAGVPTLVRPGRSERDIATGIEMLLNEAGFERPAFDTIVASGPNSALPHARPGGRFIEQGDGVLLDFGGVYDGYCVDLTRTIQIGNTGPEFRRMFAAVAEAQAVAIAGVRPGATSGSVDAAARAVLERHGLGDAFGHATGHGLGLELHEEPRIGRPGEGQADVTLEPGMVFTIEPGAYLDGIGGVRIEDDVLVTRDGCEVLTRSQDE